VESNTQNPGDKPEQSKDIGDEAPLDGASPPMLDLSKGMPTDDAIHAHNRAALGLSNKKARPGVFTVELPSCGYPYGDSIPGGKVKLLPWSTEEETLLNNMTGDTPTKLSQIISNCVLDCPVPMDDLLLSDRMYMMLMQRIRTFGPEYGFTFRCQFCGATSRNSIDLDESLDRIEMDPDAREPFDVELIDAETTVSVRFLRGRDELDVLKYVNQRESVRGKRRRGIDEEDEAAKRRREDAASQYRLALQIIAIGGEDVDTEESLRFVKRMTMGDSNDLRIAIDEVEGGVDTTVSVKCAVCRAENEITLPFSGEFFRPGRRRRRTKAK